MKKISLLLLISCFATLSFSQEFDRPIDYLEYLSQDRPQISENLMRYISATVHSDNEAEVNRKRKRLIGTIGKVKDNVSQAPPFEDNSDLKDAMMEYFTLNYEVLNDDYSRIVDMKQVSDQKVDAAQQKLDEAIVSFTSAHDIKLVASDDKVSNMLRKANSVTEYYNSVFLIVFKTQRQRMDMYEAMAARDVEAIEKSQKLIVKYADEGLNAVNGLSDFDGDSSLKDAAKQRLKFYKEEANQLGMTSITFQLEQERLDEMGAKLEKQKAKNRKKGDVLAYNKLAEEMNAAANAINAQAAKYGNLSQQNQLAWLQVVELFRRKHIPKYGTNEQFS